MSESKFQKNNNEIIIRKNEKLNLNILTTPLKQCRIIQKNLVYIIGLSQEIINKEKELRNFEYFGQYGKIIKLLINKTKTYNLNGINGPSYSCYITYSNETESSIAILALNNSIINNHLIKASYGTTKYCIHFLNKTTCLNKDCVFLHYFANNNDILYRDEMINNKNIFEYQYLMAIQLSNIFNVNKKFELENIKNQKTIFPNAYSVYNKDIVLSYIKQNMINDKLYKFENLNFDINKIYLSKNKSRFSFVNEKDTNINSIYKIEVPISLQHFISENLRYSIISKKEQNEIIDYYFSHSYDSNNIWGYLISTLNMWKEYNNKSLKNKNEFSNDNSEFI
jgi:hypothetical protein